MANVQVQRLASLVHGTPQLQSMLTAQDKHNQDFAQALNRALVLGDTVRVLAPFTAAAPLVVPGAGYANGLPYALAYTSAGQSIPSGANTVVNFDTILSDTDSAITTGAAWKFTVPAGKGGLYQVASLATVTGGAAAAGQSVILTVLKNGVEFFRLQRVGHNDTSSLGLSGSLTLPLVAGDYVQPAVFQNTGGGRTLEALNASNWASVTCLNLDRAAAPTCFPFDVLWPNAGNPTFVVAQCADTNGNNPSNLALSLPDWVLVTKGGLTQIHVRNIPGLNPSTSYAVTLVCF